MHPLPSAHQQSGMTLVEVLVALVLFSLGLLGAAGLQLSSLRSSQFSANAAVAVSLAREYEEFLQMVGSGGRLSGFSSALTEANHESALMTGTLATADTDTLTSASFPSMCTATTACDGAWLARAFQHDWSARVRTQLPGGRMVVCAMAQPYDPATSDLQWPTCTTPGAHLVIFVGWTAKNDQGETILGVDRPRMAINVYGNYYDFRNS